MFSEVQDLETFATEEDLENASLYEPSSYVGVVFMDSSAMSYRLRFPYNQLPLPSDYTESFGKELDLFHLFLLYIMSFVISMHIKHIEQILILQIFLIHMQNYVEPHIANINSMLKH